MDKKELQVITKRLNNLERELKSDYGLNGISGGFVHIDMKDYDDNIIYITIKDGVQSDCSNRVNQEEQKLNRKTLEFIN